MDPPTCLASTGYRSYDAISQTLFAAAAGSTRTKSNKFAGSTTAMSTTHVNSLLRSLAPLNKSSRLTIGAYLLELSTVCSETLLPGCLLSDKIQA